MKGGKTSKLLTYSKSILLHVETLRSFVYHDVSFQQEKSKFGLSAKVVRLDGLPPDSN